MVDLDRFYVACQNYEMRILMKLLPEDTCIDSRPFGNDQLQYIVDNKLTEKERTAIGLRFDSERPLTYKEIAKEMGVSVTRARQLVMSSINKVLNADGDAWTDL